MPVIRVTDATWARLESHAKGFQKPEDVMNLALDALDKMAGKQVAKQQKPSPTKKTVDGRKLPQKEFRQPLLETLKEFGGSAQVSDIRRVMEKKMASRISEADLALVSSGDPRWWNAICWERANLVREGLFADSERGIWKLSENGTKLVG